MPKSFSDVVTDAVADMTEHGFDDAERLERWISRIRKALERQMASPAQMERKLREALIAIYKRMIDNGGIERQHPGVPRFTIEKVKPHLRAELERRIMASAELIRLNRETVIGKVIRRFVGWASSVPKGGSETVNKRETKGDIRKALTQLPFEERRVLIDQSHKLTASLSEIIAKDGGALAGIWHSHWRQTGYAYRPDHKDRDLRVYTVRGNWALVKRLMRVGKDGYYDAITGVGEEPFCRCYMEWIYTLSALPAEMLTQKGKDELERVRGLMRADEQEYA